MVSGLQIGQREVDLLVYYRGQTWLIEIKADLPPKQAAGKIEEQLSSLGDRAGNSNKLLLIGPELQQRLQKQGKSLENLTLRCQASQVQLLSTKDELLEQLKLKH